MVTNRMKYIMEVVGAEGYAAAPAGNERAFAHHERRYFCRSVTGEAPQKEHRGSKHLFRWAPRPAPEAS